MNKYYDVILGALLHDIGKFYQKGKNTSYLGIIAEGKHPLISAKFVEHFRNKLSTVGFDVDLIKEIVQRHHSYEAGFEDSMLSKYAPVQYRDYCLLVDAADSASSAERSFEEISGNNIKIEGTVEDAGNSKTRTLTSIFSVVGKTEKLYGQSVGLYKDVVDKVSSENNKSTTELNSKHIESFERQFNLIEAKDKRDFINKVDSILREYLWCIPSDSYRKIVTDISLYDHLKTTAMIADIMLRQNKIKDNKLSLVYIKLYKPYNYLLSRDIGILQEDLFNKANRLRQFLQNAIDSVLNDNEIQSPETNVVYNGQYDALLVVGDSSNTENRINEINMKIASYTNMQTYLSATYIDVNEIKLNNTYKYIRMLQDSIKSRVTGYNKVKLIGVNNIIAPKNRWITDLKVELDDHTSRECIEYKSSNKVYAIIRIDYKNINDIIDDLFTIDSNTINRWNKNGDSIADGIELGLGTISRMATVYRTMYNMTNMGQWFDCIVLNQSENSVVFITPINNLGNDIKTYINNIDKASISLIKQSIYITTFNMTDNLSRAYRNIMNICENTTGLIYYNGVYIKEKDISEIDAIFKMVEASYKKGKSVLYKIQGYVKEIKAYILNRQGIPMSFSRFNHRLNTGSLNNSLTVEFKNYLTDKFSKLLSIDNNDIFLALDTIIRDVISEERIESNE